MLQTSCQREQSAAASILSNLAELPHPLLQHIMHEMTGVSARTSFRSVGRAARCIADTATCKLHIQSRSHVDPAVSHVGAASCDPCELCPSGTHGTHHLDQELGHRFSNLSRLSVDCTGDLTLLAQLCRSSPQLLKRLDHIHVQAKAPLPFHLAPYLSKLRDTCSPNCHVQVRIATDTEGYLIKDVTFDFPDQIPDDLMDLLRSATLQPAATLTSPTCAQHLMELNLQTSHCRVDIGDLADEGGFEIDDDLMQSETDLFGNSHQALSLLKAADRFHRLQDLYLCADLISVVACALHHVSSLTALTNLEMVLEGDSDAPDPDPDQDPQLAGTTAEQLNWSMLGKVPSLQVLVIACRSEPQIAIPDAWSSLTALTRLSVESTEVRDLDVICTLRSLHHLRLDRLAADAPLDFLEDLKKLSHFETNLGADHQLRGNRNSLRSPTGDLLGTAAMVIPHPPAAALISTPLGTSLGASPPSQSTVPSSIPVSPHLLASALALNTYRADAFAACFNLSRAAILGISPPASPLDASLDSTLSPPRATILPSPPVTICPLAPPRSAPAPPLPLTSISFSSHEGVIPPGILKYPLPNIQAISVKSPAAISLDPSVTSWLSQPQLKTLDLQLRGITPSATLSQMSNLHNLAALRLQGDGTSTLDVFDSKLTAWVAGLTKLTELKLSFADKRAQVSTAAPLHSSSSLQHLQKLSLKHIHLDARVSEWLAELSSLTELTLHHCGSGSSSNSNSSSNSFARSANLDPLRGMLRLQKLQIGQLTFDFNLAAILASLTSLQSLELFGCSGNLSAWEHLPDLHSLPFLASVYIRFDGWGVPEIIQWLSTAPDLRSLEIWHRAGPTGIHSGPPARQLLDSPCFFPRLHTLDMFEMPDVHVVALLRQLHAPQLQQLQGPGCEVPPDAALPLLFRCPLLKPLCVRQLHLQLSAAAPPGNQPQEYQPQQYKLDEYQPHKYQPNEYQPQPGAHSLNPSPTQLPIAPVLVAAVATVGSTTLPCQSVSLKPPANVGNVGNVADVANTKHEGTTQVRERGTLLPVYKPSSDLIRALGFFPISLQHLAAATLPCSTDELDSTGMTPPEQQQQRQHSSPPGSRQPGLATATQLTLQHKLGKQLTSLILESGTASPTTLSASDAQRLASSCPCLKSLTLLSFEDLTGPVLKSLTDLKDLEFVRLVNCTWLCVEDVVQWLKQLPRLRLVVVEGCEQVPSHEPVRLMMVRRLAEVGVFVPLLDGRNAWMMPDGL